MCFPFLNDFTEIMHSVNVFNLLGLCQNLGYMVGLCS